MKEQEELGSGEAGPDEIMKRFIDMMNAADRHDLSALYEAWEAGTKLIDEGKSTVDKVVWDAYYFKSRYDAGDPDGLDALRKLRRENPRYREPILVIGYALRSASEHGEAAKMFLEAAALPDNAHKIDDLVSAARELAAQKRHAEALAILEKLLPDATGDAKREATSLLYDVLRDSGEIYFAFATAEAALHDNLNST